MKISIIASAIRTNLWDAFSKSLQQNKIEYEIIFAGPKVPDKEYPNLTHIKTGNIKPAQCIYIASLYATGELVHWSADDCEYPDGILDDVYGIYEGLGDAKCIIACETIENSRICPVNSFILYDAIKDSPIMAPLGFMNLKYMRDLGGISDRRYTGGQYENDLLMRAYADGARLFSYDSKRIELDHTNKHTNKCSAFSDGYKHGRKVLETSWPPHSRTRHDFFEPFENREDLLTSSQSYKGIWD